MKLIVGLGNPGKEYQNTRHNIGFMVLDNYLGKVKWIEKYNAYYYEENIKNDKIIFIKPLTYMNLSGDSIIKFVNFYKVDLSDILVIHDDLDLPFKTYKLKQNSSSGGHNGIKSIINNLNSKDFARLKIGISHDRSIDTKDYVLNKFSKEELDYLEKMYPIFNEIINSYIINGFEKTVSFFNRKDLTIN